jgi:hypothetical protein
LEVHDGNETNAALLGLRECVLRVRLVEGVDSYSWLDGNPG